MVVLNPAEHKGIIERAHDLPRTPRNAAMAPNIQRYVDGDIVKRQANRPRRLIGLHDLCEKERESRVSAG